MAHEWIINNDNYEGRPRWYTCPVCRYTYDNFVDHVSETGYCPNCKNEMGEKKGVPKQMRHLIVLTEEEIKSLLEGKKIDVICYGSAPIVIMSEDTFNKEES